jgi:hypothetical protein
MRTIKKVMAGLQVLAKRTDIEVCAEHDIVVAGPLPQDIPEKLELLALGWFWSKTYDGWGIYT